MLTDTQKIEAFLSAGKVTLCKPHKARGIKVQRKIAKPSRAFLAIWANPADKYLAHKAKVKALTMRKFRFALSHDQGTTRITVPAFSFDAAIMTLMNVEGCPRRSISAA